MRPWLCVGLMLGGCEQAVVSGASIAGDGCVTWDPVRERGPIQGAWIVGEPATLEVSWAWLGLPQGGQEWEVDLVVDDVSSSIVMETDGAGSLSLPLDATEAWSASFREPSEPNAYHWATMRPVSPDETAVLCVGHREPTGEQREVRAGRTETVEILTHRADGMQVEIWIVEREFVAVFDDERSTLSSGVVPVVDGRAEFQWDVPGPFLPAWDRLEAQVRLVGPDGPKGAVEIFELSQ